MTASSFYRAFEDRHRGSRELIKSRLGVYLPFVEPLKQAHSDCSAIDLGCGRGEWLELLQQHGFTAYGVDLDADMLAACTERGLVCVKQDATAHLKSLADDSQCVVSGFHIAEHLPFPELQMLVEESLRVLKPGGLLILETPNPENIVVGATNFYLDPTHQRPIPPPLLAFLPEHYGFARTKILRLQESPELESREAVGFLDVLEGASPDYAVVAQKGAAAEVLLAFDDMFDASYGLELGSLASRYDATLDRRFVAMEQRIVNAESEAANFGRLSEKVLVLNDRLLAETVRAERSETQAATLSARLLMAEKDLAVAEARAAELDQERERQRIEANFWWRATAQLTQELKLVYGSLSWRVTAPLRWVRGWFRFESPSQPSSPRAALRNGVRLAARYVRARPSLRSWIGGQLDRFPSVKRHIKRIATEATVSPAAPGTTPTGTQSPELDLGRATKNVYAELRAQLGQRRDRDADPPR